MKSFFIEGGPTVDGYFVSRKGVGHTGSQEQMMTQRHIGGESLDGMEEGGGRKGAREADT